MKKTFIQTIIVFVVVNLITAGFAPAQNVTEEKSQPASKEDVAAQKQAEIAAKVAQEKAKVEAKVEQVKDEVARIQMEVAEKQMQDAQKQMAIAQEQMAMDEEMLEDYRIPRVSISPWQQRDGGEVLVIPAAELKVEDLAEITEDMSVMSRIFDNKLIQAHLTTARASLYVGFDPFSVHSHGTTEAIYLEGYAALFLMKVNFPLSPSPEAQEEKKTEVEDTDPLWKETKQEIYAPEEADRRRRTGDRPEEKYDAQKVEDLKETLIKTLKHATNIRTLKPDQSVILTVIGDQSQSGTPTVTQSYLYGRSTGRSSRMVRRAPVVPTVAASLSPTVLTICVKKSDIDAFAKGELSLDQFRELTRMFTSYAKVGKEDSPDLVHQTVAHEGHYVR